ncbi:MAG: malectin domain-containing carbohydrate-binding protein [Terriglobia bacterium]
MEVATRESQQRAELEALLASGIFAECPSLAKLLTYICEKYWEGKGDQLKEYSLGVDVLGRPPDFDPAANAIVRVKAHRLREKLKKYYEKEGAGHQLSIAIQPGHYAPQFLIANEDRLSSSPIPSVHAEVSGLLAQRPSANHGKTAASLPEAARPAVRTYPKFISVVIGIAALVAVVSFMLAHRWPRAATHAQAPVSAQKPITALPGSLSQARIIAGYAGKEYADNDGNVWLGDRYFRGGDARPSPGGWILRTLDPALFGTCRVGNFSYNIPLKPGDYQLWLYFVEAFFGPGAHQGGGGVASRVFDVQANGRTLLDHFDIISDAGGNLTADERVFKDIHPGPDGYLHLVFIRESSDPLINAIKIEPGTPGKLLPVRIVAQDVSYTGHDGERWEPDRYFLGGSLARWPQAGGDSEAGLYAGERFGNFNYAIPVAPGKYTVTLYFCEHFFGPDEPGGGGAGSRVFDVFCDGTTLLKNFDIFKEAGGWRKPLIKTFRGIEPNPQGKIDLQFDPEVNYALINAISVVDESPKRHPTVN